MINNYKKYFILIFMALFMLLNMPAQAKWWIFGQGNDEVNINYLYLNKNSYEESGSKLTLYKQNLIDGNVEISGKASVRSGKIGAVFVSRDNKQTWEKATLSTNGAFRYTFAPDIETKYDLYIKIIDTTGKTNLIDDTYKQISVIDKDMSSVVRETLDAIIRAYENEEPNLFMTYVSPNFAGDEAVLSSAVRKDFNAFDLIKINFYINNISTSPDGKTYVAISYQRTVVSTKTGNTYSDNGNTEMVFVHENGKEKIFSMKNPLMFGLSDAGNVATGTIQNTGNAPIILVDNSGNVDEKPFRDAINTIEEGSDIASDVETGNFTLVSTGFGNTQGFTFNTETVAANAGDFEIEYNIFVLPAGVGMYEIGVSSLSSITSVNTDGYTFGPGGPGFNADAGSVGKCYAFKIGNKYAVIRIKTYSDAAGDPPSTIQFEYKYQPDGSTNF